MESEKNYVKGDTPYSESENSYTKIKNDNAWRNSTIETQVEEHTAEYWSNVDSYQGGL